MIKFIKPFIIVLISFLSIWVIYSFVHRQFKPSQIKGNWPLVVSAEINEGKLALLKKIFSQSFQYLDRGKQSFVFLSEDQHYVLKFFDIHCLRSGNFPFLFPVEEDYCFKKLKQLFQGYEMGQLDDLKNTGLIFVQLAPDSSYHLHVTVIDRFHIAHDIDLSEVPFVLQQKAIPLRNLITLLLSQGNVEKAKQYFREVVDMYVDGYKRGIVDLDHNFMYNTGFVANQPIRIDLGRLQLDESVKNPKIFCKDLEKVVIRRLGEWLNRHFPFYREEILKDLQIKLGEVCAASADSQSFIDQGDCLINLEKLKPL